MAARTAEQEQRHRRRRRLVNGLLVGAAAIGVPAIANAMVRRRAARLPAPRWGRTQRYAWGDGEISFRVLGESGKPLVLLHTFGPGHDSEQWRRVGEILATRYRVYALDLLGWGRSDMPARAYDGELYIQLIHDFLADVVAERAVVVAAGLPAAYAVQVAVDSPNLVAGLGLVAPLGIEVHGDEPDLKDAAVHWLLRMPVLGTSALNLFTSRSGIANHLRREVYSAPERVDAAVIERHYRASHQPGAHAALAAYLAGYLNHGVEELLGRLTQPAWLCWGRQAAFPPVETADLWLARLDASLTVLENSANHPHVEEPAAFCRALESFLADLGN